MATQQEEGSQQAADDKQLPSPSATGLRGMIENQYRRIRENAETYPYVWGSYIVVYGGFGLWLAYRWRKLRKTEDRVRVLQERLRKIVEAEKSSSSAATTDKAKLRKENELKTWLLPMYELKWTSQGAEESTRPHEDQGISLFLPKGEGAAVDAFSFHLCFAFLFIGPDSGFELDESDVWSSVGGGVVSPDYRKPVVSSRKKPLAAVKRAEAVVGGTTSSLPTYRTG
ncbi:hypothetical protein RJ640_000207 [Escallonia rubra]|uniref:Transmembrane protein n=1 Tax=Escallonia rubra TaxID=112253 RepID=A0AA88RM05_9ASTE|nr:hypothetical protein RJ640_000207 [Escallonia rubra]